MHFLNLAMLLEILAPEAESVAQQLLKHSIGSRGREPNSRAETCELPTRGPLYPLSSRIAHTLFASTSGIDLFIIFKTKWRQLKGVGHGGG